MQTIKRAGARGQQQQRPGARPTANSTRGPGSSELPCDLAAARTARAPAPFPGDGGIGPGASSALTCVSAGGAARGAGKEAVCDGGYVRVCG